MTINGKIPPKPTADKGAILVVGGPKGKDKEREALLTSLAHRYTLMSLNSTHNRVEGKYFWDYVFVNHSHIEDHMTKDADNGWSMPEEAHVIGNDTGTMHPRVDEGIKIDPMQGSCGLLGVITAVYMGYSPVLTVGIYLNNYSQFPRESIMLQWNHWFPYLDGHVYSLSGTGLIRKMFGEYHHD